MIKIICEIPNSNTTVLKKILKYTPSPCSIDTYTEQNGVNKKMQGNEPVLKKIVQKAVKQKTGLEVIKL